MADNPSKKARVKGTGAIIEVYMHRPTGDWIDVIDCKTKYKKEENLFLGIQGE